MSPRIACTLALILEACGGLAACGSDDPANPNPGTGGAITATGGAGGLAASGGAPSGGVINAGGASAATSTGGATIIPAALGECFAPVSSAPQTCRGYCEGKGKTCVEQGCLPDGTAAASGYTWLTFEQAECPASQIPKLVSFDSCVAPFELSREIPDNQAVRCCCSS